MKKQNLLLIQNLIQKESSLYVTLVQKKLNVIHLDMNNKQMSVLLIMHTKLALKNMIKYKC